MNLSTLNENLASGFERDGGPRLTRFLFSTGLERPVRFTRVLRLVILVSKGILRNPRMRRLVMLWLMGASVVMLFFGSWLLPDAWARAHPWLYSLYWFVCGWFTLTAVLLALLDILLIRAMARATRRQLEQDIAHIDAKTKGERE